MADELLRQNGIVIPQYRNEADTGFEKVTGKNGGLNVNASIVGSLANRRGLAINKPSANTVEVGTTYWSVDTDPHGDFIEVSDGTNWVVM